MTTTNVRHTLRHNATAGILLVGGGALAAATWVGGDHGLAIGLVNFYILTAGFAYVWSRRDTDVAAIMRWDGDERQFGIDREANVITAHVMGVAAIIGAIINTAATGDPGGYGVICFVGGLTYFVAITVLRRRR
jgi:hypothetical protein